MPSRQVRKVSLSEEIAALQARFTRIESFPARTLTAIGSDINMTPSQSLGPTSSWASFTTAPFDWGFTLTRAVPMLFLGSIGYFVAAGQLVGNLSSAVRVAITATFGSVTPVNDINGNPVQSGMVAYSSATANPIGSGSLVMCATLPAGSYHVQAQYLCPGQVGATVFTIAGNLGPVPNMVGSLFTLAG